MIIFYKNTTMKKNIKFFIISIILSLLLFACEKNISVDLPPHDPKIVVEGYIEQGKVAKVILTKNVSYFDEVSQNTLLEMLIPDAKVTVSDGKNIDTLKFKVGSEYPYAYYIGKNIIGEVGKTYSLKIEKGDTLITSKTEIPEPIQLDSVKFIKEENYDSLGYIWVYYNDPIELGNFYKGFFKVIDESKVFIHPNSMLIDDRLINGQEVQYVYYKAKEPSQISPDDDEEDTEDETRFMFKVGQNVIIKFCTIDLDNFNFWKTYRQVKNASGNPFSSPGTIKSNIKGEGLGTWGGYGIYQDTIFIEMPPER